MTTATLAALSAKVHAMIPPDELVGSLDRNRIALMVRYAGGLYLEEGTSQARRWLAYALNTDIPYGAFDQLCGAATIAGEVEDGDLEFWFDEANSGSNRDRMLTAADQSIDFTVDHLTTILCAQLGVS